MSAGRPQTQLDLPSGWQHKVLAIYSNGGSDVEVKACIYKLRGTFSNDLWNRWLTDEEEFSQTIKKGKLLSQAWWYKQGRKNLKIKEFNYTGWYMQMKNRFGWKDKNEDDPAKLLVEVIRKSNQVSDED